MSIRNVLISLVVTVIYWYFAGNWASGASYVWAADPKFGITDEMSPWPMRIALAGYLLIAALFVILVRARRKKG